MLKSQQDSSPRDADLHGISHIQKMKVIVDGEQRYRPIARYNSIGLPEPELLDGEDFFRTISDTDPTIIRVLSD